MAVKTVLESVRDALHSEMERDPSVFLMGEDIGPRGNVFRITAGFLDEFGRDRVVDTPLAEASIVGIAVGAAMAGMRPVAEIQFADFIYPAYNQIVGEAAKIRYRSAGGNSCPLVVRTPYGGGVRGALSHSVSVEALFYHVPGLKVCAPSTPADTQGLLTSAIRDDDPVLFLEHKRTYRLIKGEVPAGDYTVPIGKADVARTGKDVSVITYGLMRHFAMEAAEQLAGQGIETEVIDLRSIRPMDRETILNSIGKTRKALIVHEDQKFGGIGAEVSAIIAEEALFELDAPVKRLCGPDVPAMGYAKEYEEAFMPSPARIADAIKALADF
ncbi:MAG: alpha-ketoacid dehydrogenase subunit beta [Candidatus Eremiobacter antarcticus]|nr:alpha-ketoacid dehydrogenase subunit beta [Candidatus Eremiobacteraeota bacterium]MBC5807876.1 alpha-ketoacid dehydrogenase subunit beta [Candidatus Eremiobacteraeota bacterium]PZR62753.1 MAG: alpha-ketoacid dehydrogenase subunit beta [Candidatus Eremiobacter sp. RRmetagenome_bin22]